MLVSATATIALDGWPPPTIEINALLAALGDCGHQPAAGPATAFQHLNEVDISFAFEVADGVRADSRAQQIVRESMSRVYGGPIHVQVDVPKAGPVETGPAETGQVMAAPAGERHVVDLTAPAMTDSPERPGLDCAASGCDRPAALYDVRIATVGTADGELELTLALCAQHARALGQRAVSKVPV